MSGMEAHRIFAVAEQAGAAQQPGMPGPSADRSGSHTSSGQRSADSPRLLREINDQVVLRLLLEHGQLTRGRIGELTGLSKPTVSSLLARLESRGLVTTTGVVQGAPVRTPASTRCTPGRLTWSACMSSRAVASPAWRR